jgi:carbamoyltransferase
VPKQPNWFQGAGDVRILHADTEPSIECQNTTRHDASVAAIVGGAVYALAAERVDRIKHSCDAGAADSYLRARFPRVRFPDLDCAYSPYRDPHHHLSHAAGAYYTSPFSRALILVLDGMGPHEHGSHMSTSLWVGVRDGITHLASIEEQGICYRSIGHYYAAASYYLGFPFHDVSFTMSLAAYGDPARYRAAVASLIWPTGDGLFDTDGDFIRFATHVRFGRAFGWREDAAWLTAQRARYEGMLGPRRGPQDELLARHRDLAAAVQERLELVLAAVVRHLRSRAPEITDLCYAGGVALNCVANQRVLPAAGFRAIHIQPAASDDGIALGRLLYQVYRGRGRAERERSMTSSVYLGPPYGRADLEAALEAVRDRVVARRLSRAALLAEVARRIAAGEVIAWVQGRSEFGPRALGHRSVLADPRNPSIAAVISDRLKKREWFRPFAPSVLESRVAEYFDVHASMRLPMRYMLAAVTARPAARTAFPGALHVDGTARVHAVPEDGSIYAALLSAYARETGVPGLLNTSLNVPGAPIVEAPAEALELLLATRLDALALGPWLVERRDQA